MRKYSVRLSIAAADNGKDERAEIHLGAQYADSIQEVVAMFQNAPQGMPEPPKDVMAEHERLVGIQNASVADLGKATPVAATPNSPVSAPTETQVLAPLTPAHE